MEDSPILRVFNMPEMISYIVNIAGNWRVPIAITCITVNRNLYEILALKHDLFTTSHLGTGIIKSMSEWACSYMGCPHNKDVCIAAASMGYINVIRWALKNGVDWNWRICSTAARFGHLKVLQWAKEKHYEWNVNICYSAAQDGQLNVLRWARENNCGWNASICEAAAENGHFDVLKWARENGCDWNQHTCIAAARNNHLAILQWALSNRCQCQWKKLTFTDNKTDTYKWIKKNRHLFT